MIADGWYKYTGADGSLGLISGNKYRLVVSGSTNHISVNIMLTTSPIQHNAAPFLPVVQCLYDSEKSFYENWVRA